MLDSITDVDRLASSAICVGHFATHNVVKAPPYERALEVKAWMEINDFDVLPIQGKHKPMVILRSRLEDINSEQSIKAFSSSVKREQLVSISTPLRMALEKLSAHGWLLVYDDNDINGIVTVSDLGRPAVSVYLFARIISLEHGLRRLLGSYSNTPISDEPRLDGEISAGPEYLKDVLKAIREVPELIHSLGFSSKTAFERGTNFIVALRNHLAHGRSLLSQTCDAHDAFKRIEKLEGIVCKISALLIERDQIWKAFEKTCVIQKDDVDIVWAGPCAATLPLPAPIHIITAFNPCERVLSVEDNQKRQEALGRLLELRLVQFVPVYGMSPDCRWLEQSFAVHGFSRSEACTLARNIGQRAIFELDDEYLFVVDCDEIVRGRRLRAE